MEPAISEWPHAIVHVDADCFYVSCELLRNPQLKGIPVGVLSSQDACVVSKSYEAKKNGIKTGTTRWDAEKICPGMILIPADFLFYEQISRKMFTILRTMSPEVEVFSIDEAFVTIKGLEKMYRSSYGEIGNRIRTAIYEQIGVTASVGVSITKTLAKMASEKNKPNGLTVVSGVEIEDFLKTCEVGEICGVGWNRVQLLKDVGITSAFEFYNADQRFIKKILGKAGVDLWYELHGVSVNPVNPIPPLPKGLMRTASLGGTSSDREYIWAKLCYHTFRLTTALATQDLLARKVYFFLGTKDHQHYGRNIDLPEYKNSYETFIKAIRPIFNEVYNPYERYHKCGVSASDIIKSSDNQTDIFGAFFVEERKQKFMCAVEKINKKHGSRTLEPTVLLPITKNKTKNGRIGRDILICY